MDKQAAIKLIKTLSDVKGAPGFEHDVAKTIMELGLDLGDFSQDKMTNLYLERKGNETSLDEIRQEGSKSRLRFQLDAHLDEVGFMVSAIRPNGCLEFMTLGGWVTSNIPAHLVWVRTRDGNYVQGLTTSKPPHFLSAAERDSALKMEDIVIDLGTSSKEETEALGIEIAAPIVPDATCTYDETRDLFIGKAFDCRAGCAAIIDTLDQLKDEDLEVDVIAGFSTQEETGLRGSKVTANNIQADIAIVFEGCPCDDTFSPDYKIQTALGKGPMLRHIDAGMITHPGFQRYAIDLASKHGIPMQRAVRSGGSTNGASIHLSNAGVPVIVIGIPVRYIHTSYGMMTYHDHAAAVKLAVEIIKSMNDEVYAGL